MVLLFERVVSLEVEKAYEELKNLLLNRKCKIVAEERSKSIRVEQGSLWGVSPKGVKKTISFHLHPKNSETRIAGVSSLASDWIIISTLSYVIAGILSPFSWLFAIDLESSGFYSTWAISYFKITSILLAIVVIVGIIWDIFIYAGKDSFAEETLRLLP